MPSPDGERSIVTPLSVMLPEAPAWLDCLQYRQASPLPLVTGGGVLSQHDSTGPRRVCWQEPRISTDGQEGASAPQVPQC